MTTQTDHAALIDAFYEAFAKRDADAMNACYHPDIAFSDPVFPDLRGDDARAMWEMLCAQGKDLEVEHSAVVATEAAGSAHWDARYTFATGNKVLNRIDATFEFADGLIVKHTDRFDLYKWSRQALGIPGVLLGWTPMMQGQIRKQAAKSLRKFIARRAAS